MQFKTSALLLLASIASVIAETPDEILDDTLSDVNDRISKALQATTVLVDIQNMVTTIIGNVQNEATIIVNEVNNYPTDVGYDFDNVLPTITVIPPNVDDFFNSVGSKVENLQIPTIAWNDIKIGLYPPEVSQWVDSLPTSMRAEASQRLTQWANDVGNTASIPNRGTVVLGALGAAAVLALALAL
ncbi:hypothetical protein EV426DRAFT_602808 [Tirmania nivea]|nr:hypothetical protein EV426DRAFT_602808 [Tirmania nivea]